ncbi:MAG: sensor histidine kinase, partial [Eubacteriales bacterium]
PVDITEVIKNTITKLKPALQDKGVNVVEGGTDREIVVQANHDRVEQVMSNLLDNAVRYSPAGGNITVSVVEHLGMVEVTVVDEGEGIPAEELSLIWERFYKVDKARSRETGGTGLGLAIVRQIIESLGGEVKAASEVGRGTKIGFLLPVSQGDTFLP